MAKNLCNVNKIIALYIGMKRLELKPKKTLEYFGYSIAETIRGMENKLRTIKENDKLITSTFSFILEFDLNKNHTPKQCTRTTRLASDRQSTEKKSQLAITLILIIER